MIIQQTIRFSHILAGNSVVGSDLVVCVTVKHTSGEEDCLPAACERGRGEVFPSEQ